MGPTHQIPWDIYEQWARAQWAARHGKAAADRLQYRQMAQVAGYDPQRVTKQRRAGALPVYAVRDYARGLGLDPIEAMASWAPMALLEEQAAPSPAEWLTQIPASDLYVELLRRLGRPVPPRDPAEPLEAAPQAWVAHLLDGPRGQPPGARGQRRKDAAQLLEIPYNSLLTKERRGSWTIPELDALCRWSGGSFRLGLALTDWFTWEELGLDPTAPYDALRLVDPTELTEAVKASLPRIRDHLANT